MHERSSRRGAPGARSRRTHPSRSSVGAADGPGGRNDGDARQRRRRRRSAPFRSTDRSALMRTYRGPTGRIREGSEARELWDARGRRYLDFLCGIAVTSLGHAHPEVARAVSEQARTLVHTSNLFANRAGTHWSPRHSTASSATARLRAVRCSSVTRARRRTNALSSSHASGRVANVTSS